jgi:hypothetical protein
MKKIDDLAEKLKKVGIDVVTKVKETYNTAKESMDKNFLNDSLKRRFNLENPYKFIIMSDKSKTNIVNELMPRNAKRYIDDEIFVFFGTLEDNDDIKVGNYIKDISDNSFYEVLELASVKVSVTYENKEYEVNGVAVNGRLV